MFPYLYCGFFFWLVPVAHTNESVRRLWYLSDKRPHSYLAIKCFITCFIISRLCYCCQEHHFVNGILILNSLV
uniref:Secreted protein n=1 Tax=Arundo donax TaxID=35708 RepID=A0A0A8ZV73_ARUDO